DRRLDRVVALKVLHPGLVFDSDARRRFNREARLASKLKHPNIAAIYDTGQVNGWEFIVMEYVEGKDLSEIISANGLAIPTCLAFAIQIANALKASHAAKIIHRDLKPSNLRITPGGVVKLLDFGAAKTTAHKEGSTVGIIGTVEFMSPEQFNGQHIDE